MADPIRLKPRRPCPICSKPSAQATHPFCSARCAQIDLGKWLGGQYVLPSNEPLQEQDLDSERDSD
jgi:uncharacterized protein